MNLPDRLDELAEFLEHDQWTIPVTAVDDCREAARELRRLAFYPPKQTWAHDWIESVERGDT